jgi:hypothetical protein
MLCLHQCFLFLMAFNRGIKVSDPVFSSKFIGKKLTQKAVQHFVWTALYIHVPISFNRLFTCSVDESSDIFTYN